MNKGVYEKVKEFKNRYPMTISWRLKAHSKVIESHINPDETVRFAFAAQKNDNPLDIITTYVIVVTNKRILLGQKRLVFGYFFTAITPDLFNDIKIRMGLVWGKIIIDTVREKVFLSNIQREALDIIETEISEFMMEEKQKYVS